MALRSGRLLFQKLSKGVSRSFSTEAETRTSNLLNERRNKLILDEIRSLREIAEADIAYWGPRPPQKVRHLNEITSVCFVCMYVMAREIYRDKSRMALMEQC